MQKELEMCPQYTDAPAFGYQTIKLQNSTWYKCLNLSTENLKTICPASSDVKEEKVVQLSHPPYLPDLSPYDFSCFLY